MIRSKKWDKARRQAGAEPILVTGSGRWRLVLILLLFGAGLFDVRAALDSSGRTNEAFIVDAWSTEEGLPENVVTSMVQTQDGYLWLGTLLGGLVRFDGVRFTVFDEGNTPGLNSSRIVKLFEDSHRNLWVGTENAGVVVLRDGRVLNLGQGRTSLEGRLASACEDPGGAVWLYMTDGRLWRYRDGDARLFKVGAEQASDYRGIIAEQSGSVLIGADRFLSILNWQAAGKGPDLPLEPAPGFTLGTLEFILASEKGGSWRLADGRIQRWRTGQTPPEGVPDWYPWLRKASLYAPRVYAACEDRMGNLIVGTQRDGLYWFDANGGARSVSTNQGLSSNYILSLLVDKEGDLWVGTDGGGLNRVRRPAFEILDQSRGQVVQSVAEDSQGGLWIGYNNGAGSYLKEGAVPSKLPTIKPVFIDRQQRVWSGSWDFGKGTSNRSTLSLWQEGRPNPITNLTALGVVSAIFQDRPGRIWVGAQRGLAYLDEHTWTVLTTRDGLSSDAVQAIGEGPSAAIWIGTADGLNRWQDGKFTVFHKGDNSIPSDRISAIYTDSQGTLWVGTDGGGLARMREGRWTRYTRNDGLASNAIAYLIEDGLGYLWIGSNAGLMRVELTALNEFAEGRIPLLPCRVYGKSDGLPTRECSMGSQPGPCRTREGKLWFPTIKGLASISPAALKPNSYSPPVVIESVLVAGRPLDLKAGPEGGPAQAISIPARKEGLEFQYTSLSLSAPERARFKYRLEGHEKAWTEVGNVRSAHYPKLPPGNYRFHVTACNEDGVWNSEGTTFAFTVLPPFWRTAWFLGSTTALLIGAIAALVYYLSTQKLQRQLALLKQQETLERERSRIARDIHDQLGASLTQVALLGELVEGDKDSPDEVQEHARQISQTARDTTRVLDEIVWAVNPSNDTLDGLMTYICKYAQEYLAVAGLHYRLDAPGQLPSNPIPPEVRHNVFLTCKEAVTNVVRHAKATEVHLRLRLEPTFCALEIQDNGRGLGGLDEKAAQSRNGLRNMRKRMEAVGGDFTIGPAPGGGTLVRLTVPLGGGHG